MGKPLLGLILGGVLGAFDGLSALVSAGHDPEIRAGIAGIVAGSTFKGLVAGIIIGYFARKVRSIPAGLVFGLIVGAFFAFLIALMQGKYWVEIMLPGSIVGLIVGFATQKYDERPRTPAAG